MKKDRTFYRFLWVLSTVGINLVAATFIGLGVGYWLDKLFKTSPWLTIIFLILGIIAGFRNIFRLAMKTKDKENRGEF